MEVEAVMQEAPEAPSSSLDPDSELEAERERRRRRCGDERRLFSSSTAHNATGTYILIMGFMTTLFNMLEFFPWDLRCGVWHVDIFPFSYQCWNVCPSAIPRVRHELYF